MNRPLIGLTMGDPAGIGPELCLRTLGNPRILHRCDLVIFGHTGVLQRAGAAVGLTIAPGIATLQQFARTHVHGPAIVNCPGPDAAAIVPGRVSAECGAAAFGYIRTAIAAACAGEIDAVVTAPIHKEALRLANVPHPGHTEIFTELTGARRTCMMLRSDALTVSFATTHIGYADVPQRLSPERILDVIELTRDALAAMIGRPPRLAVCGLNPHAGEHGLFGQREEERLVEPAINAARQQGVNIEGPLPPDTVFTSERRKRWDGIICLYHDQGHIPFKMLSFDDGVNITLGLPIIRTSVDHGTAFDIAWKGSARPTSLFKAVDDALRLASSHQVKPQPT